MNSKEVEKLRVKMEAAEQYYEYLKCDEKISFVTTEWFRGYRDAMQYVWDLLVTKTVQ